MVNGFLLLPFYVFGQIILAVLAVILHFYEDNKLIVLIVGGFCTAVSMFVFACPLLVCWKDPNCKKREPVELMELGKHFPKMQNKYNLQNKLLFSSKINENLNISNEKQKLGRNNKVIKYN